MVAVAKAVARALIPRRLRNWLRRPGASLAWLRDSLAHAAGRDRLVAIRPGWSVRCHPAAYRCDYRVFVDDPEQALELDTFIANCSDAMTLLDLGAHFGLFSLAALHYGGPGARALAVDPSPTAVRMLRCQARLNGVERRLEVIHAAASAREGTLDLVDAGVAAGGYYVPAERHPMGERTAVPSVTIDSLARAAPGRLTHIKIDVEGAEAEVLRGARAVLTSAHAPILFVELHNAISARVGRDPIEALSLLADRGYALFRLDGTPATPEWILERDLVRIIARPAGA